MHIRHIPSVPPAQKAPSPYFHRRCSLLPSYRDSLTWMQTADFRLLRTGSATQMLLHNRGLLPLRPGNTGIQESPCTLDFPAKRLFRTRKPPASYQSRRSDHPDRYFQAPDLPVRPSRSQLPPAEVFLPGRCPARRTGADTGGLTEAPPL